MNSMTTSRLFLFALLSVLLCGQAYAATYYVRNGGSDNADGLSDANAWATLSKINSFATSPGFRSGDVIQFKRGSVWSNDETIGMKQDGTFVNWGTINGLTFKDYGTGNKPWLNCASQRAFRIYGYDTLSNIVLRNLDVSGMGAPAPNWQITNIYFNTVNNVLLDSIYADGQKGTSDYSRIYELVKFEKLKGEAIIQNSEIVNFIHPTMPYTRGCNMARTWEGGILIDAYYVSVTTQASFQILNNTIHDITCDILQAANVQSEKGFRIAGNRFYHFAENAMDFKSCNNILIEDNEIWRDFGVSYKYYETQWPNVTYTGGSIIVHAIEDGSASTNIVIRNNYLHTGGKYDTMQIRGNDIKIYNNVFRDAIGNFFDNSNRVEIYNNAWDMSYDPVYSNFLYRSDPHMGAIYFERNNRALNVHNNVFFADSATIKQAVYYVNTASSGNMFRDNIFYVTKDSSDTYAFILEDKENNNAFPIMDHNLFFNPHSDKRVLWDGIVYQKNQQATWQGLGHPGDLFTNPVFADPTKVFGSDARMWTSDDGFRPAQGSPACGASSTGKDIGAYLCGGNTVIYLCGDGLDNDGDGKTDYPADSGCSSSTDNDEKNCGNGACETGESCTSCPADCGNCQAVCGDGACNGGETCSSCPADCGTCAVLKFLPGQIIEAEKGTLTSPMQIGSHDQASGGSFISTPTDYLGSAKYSFQIDAAGDYIMEARIIAPTTGDDSFYVGFDSENANGNDAYAWDTIETSSWRKVNVSKRGSGDSFTSQFDPMVWTLAPGTHTFTFYGRESGTKIDTLMLKKITVCKTGETLPCDGCVTVTELGSYLSRWKNNEEGLTLQLVMEAIKGWKGGC